MDSANTYHRLKIKEALPLMWEKPILNKQVQHIGVLLSSNRLPLVYFFFLYKKVLAKKHSFFMQLVSSENIQIRLFY